MKLKPLGINVLFKIHNYCTGARIRFSELRMKRRISSSGNIAIQGSYTMGNVGDLAAGMSLRRGLTKAGVKKAHLFADGLEGFSHYGMFILGGGGCLYDIKDNLFYRLKPLGTLQQSLVVGVGVQGVITSDAGKKAMEKLNEADAITVRDQYSKNVIEQFVEDKPVEVTACPSFTMLPKGKHTGSFWENCIGVSLRDWFLCEHGL